MRGFSLHYVILRHRPNATDIYYSASRKIWISEALDATRYVVPFLAERDLVSVGGDALLEVRTETNPLPRRKTMNPEELQYIEEVPEPERKVAYSYETYAGGGMIVHEFDDVGFHRLRTGEGAWPQEAKSRWVPYECLSVLDLPGNPGYRYVGASAYGLLDNATEGVFRVEALTSVEALNNVLRRSS